jgi:hypothetical protein
MSTKSFPVSNRVSAASLQQLTSSGNAKILPYAITPKDNQDVLLFTDKGDAAIASYKGDNNFKLKPTPEKEVRTQMALMIQESFEHLAKNGNGYSPKDVANPSQAVLRKITQQCLPKAEPSTVTPLVAELSNLLLPVER